MLKQTAVVLLLSSLVVACGSTNKKQQAEKLTNQVEADTVKSTVNEAKPLLANILILENIQFADGMVENKIKVECKMLQSLSESIMTTSERYSYQFTARKDVTPDQANNMVVKVDYVEVVPQKFSIWAFHPVSVATLKVSLVDNGKVVKSATKEIGSKMAWGTCDRLEKIARAGGQFVAKWTAKHVN